MRADAAVGTVGGDDQVVLLCEVWHVARLELSHEIERYAQRPTAFPEDLEEPLAGDAREAVAARQPHLVPIADLDGVPAIEGGGDLFKRGLIVVLQVAERL